MNVKSGNKSTDVLSTQYQQMRDFQYKDVKLKDPVLKAQYEETLRFFLSIPNDDLLRGFRVRKGMYDWDSVPGTSMGGWYENHPFSGATFGQWLSFFAKSYLITGNEAAKEKASELLDGFTEALGDDGDFAYSTVIGEHAQHYTYDKLVLGMTDLYLYAEMEKAKDVLARITEWSLINLDRHRCLPTDNNFVGIRSKVSSDNEWYTLSENLYRAYLVTGETVYKEFAKVWEYNPFWEALRLRQGSYWKGLHAYSHVNSVGGAALAYKVTGEYRYYETLDNFFNAFSEYEFTDYGGYGPGECLVGDAGNLGSMMREYKWTYEVPCCTWAGFKLGRYLLELTCQSRAGDWIEKQLYNTIEAALPMRNTAEHRGETFYYACFAQKGATKFYFHEGWPCCSGTYPLCLAEYSNLIYMQSKKALFINLFISSEVRYETQGGVFILTQTSEFPRKYQTRFVVDGPEGKCLDLRIRCPQWLNGQPIITINGILWDGIDEGQNWGTQSAPDSWISMDGLQNSDAVEIMFPAKLRFKAVDSQNPYFGTFTYGPVMLVSEGTLTGEMKIDLNRLEEYFIPAEQPLHYRVTDDLGRTFDFKPYMDIEENAHLSSYFQL